MPTPDLQQSSLYIEYVQSLGWHIETVDGVHILIKRIPLFGTVAKIQRFQALPALNKLIPILARHRVRWVAPEPVHNVDPKKFLIWCKKLSQSIKINTSPFLPTKTILVDVTASEPEIFKRFSEAKRRATRRAIKHGVTIKESNDINDLIQIKNKSAGLFGFITTYGIKQLWNIFTSKKTAVLLAVSDSSVVGGVLLLFWNKIAYYWIAGATRKGKKLFAPTLLVWEALKLSKKRGCKQFDFVGVWDERLPKQYDEWKGFTKFKEGFGGKNRHYPIFSSRASD